MARKVFISFLGFSNYGSCHYVKGEYISKEVRFVQEATIEYLNTISSWTENDEVIILLTDGARDKNWLDDGQMDKEGNTIYQNGLKRRLELLGLPFKITPITGIPDGNNEKEIMQIFSCAFKCIQEGDELYFDLTHGFRYLPMLALVLGNYAKFLRNAKVKSITYGNYEGRNRETNEAQLIDLMPLNSLQEWTSGAADFLENGSVNHLCQLTEDTFQPLLRATHGQDQGAQALRKFANSLENVVEDFQTCRGLNIVHGTNIKALKSALNKAMTSAPAPLTPILDKIKGQIGNFSGDNNLANGFNAASWCCQNGLYQQAITILQENTVSFFAQRHNILLEDEIQRGCINQAFEILASNISEEYWKVEKENKEKVKEIMADEYLHKNDVLSVLSMLKEVRNDINHSGMRRNPMQAYRIKSKTEQCINSLIDILQ